MKLAPGRTEVIDISVDAFGAESLCEPHVSIDDSREGEAEAKGFIRFSNPPI